jgi:uncharacterized protein (TIGR00730 family)
VHALVSRLCVFCGSSPGLKPAYFESARTVGRLLAERGIGLVFGGGRVGLMGALADAALEAGGEAIGVIPRILETREVAHLGLTKLHVVETMHERKALMTEYADAFLALPGGYGTLDELFEAITWRQLKFHDKPSALLDIDGYFSGLVEFLERAVREGFIRASERPKLRIGSDAGALIDELLGRAEGSA